MWFVSARLSGAHISKSVRMQLTDANRANAQCGPINRWAETK